MAVPSPRPAPDDRRQVLWLRDRGAGPKCPEWRRSGDHTDSSSREDRAHWGEFFEVDLSLHRPTRMMDGSTAPDRAMVVLEQDENEAQPKVRLVTAQGHDSLVMTPAEAAELADTLLTVSRSAAQAPQPVRSSR